MALPPNALMQFATAPAHARVQSLPVLPGAADLLPCSGGGTPGGIDDKSTVDPRVAAPAFSRAEAQQAPNHDAKIAPGPISGYHTVDDINPASPIIRNIQQLP